MRAFLVRVAIDSTYGHWNGPVDPQTRRFVYFPIPEMRGQPFRHGLRRPYTEFWHDLKAFSMEMGRTGMPFDPPRHLLRRNMHLDPDFEYHTYGDKGARAKQLRELERGDVITFYAGLKPTGRVGNKKLNYAIIGLYVIDEIVPAKSVPKHRWHENAHTRRTRPDDTEIVIRAQPGISGRLERCIEIGDYRDGAYRVWPDLLDRWGGLSVTDGYIQRSGRLPEIMDPDRFYHWFKQQDVRLVKRNNYVPPKVIFVMLRRPKRGRADEMRSDPFWEFGSFGSTRCHAKNLMHLKNTELLEGAHLAFVQGGPRGLRLVHVTPPVRVFNFGGFLEARWEPSEMPMTYDVAPLIIDNRGRSNFSVIKKVIADVQRGTWEGRFSSAFRSRVEPLGREEGYEIVHRYAERRAMHPDRCIAESYVEALPYPPPKIDENRRGTYVELLRGGRGRGRCQGR